MTIEPTTIFPKLVRDVENRVLNYAAPRDLVALSGVNKYAYEHLSNSSYFCTLFAQKYPLLAKTDQIFSQLKTFYANSQWKIACCSMEDHMPFTAEFIERAQSSIAKELCAQRQTFIDEKERAEQVLRRICGSRYADPSSPIHQAWIAWSQNRVQHDLECARSKIEIEKLLIPFSSVIECIGESYPFPPYVATESITQELKIELATRELLGFLTNKKALSSFATSEQEDSLAVQHLDPQRKAEYQKVGLELTLICEQEREQQQCYNLQLDTYRGFESRRQASLEVIKKCLREVAKIDAKLSKVCQINRSFLLIDQYFARNAEKFMYDAYKLGSMKNIPMNLESMPFQDVIVSYRQRINACSQSALIWELFYHCYGRGVSEEQWAEKHFFQHPQEIGEVVTRLGKMAQSFKEHYWSNLDISMGDFARQHFDEIKKRLPFLKAFCEDPRKALQIIESSALLNSEQIKLFQEGAGLPVFNLLVLIDPIRYLLVNNLDSFSPVLKSLISHMEQGPSFSV